MGFWGDVFSGLDPTASDAGRNAAWARAGHDLDKSVSDIFNKVGLLPNQVDPNSPGANVDTAQTAADQQQQQTLVQQLLNQTKNGDPAALAQLQKSTDNAQSADMAIGQTAAQQQGLGNMAARQGMETAQAKGAQTGVAQADILKAEGQQNAQGELAGQLLGMRGSDVAEASAQQQAKSGITGLNQALVQNAQQNVQNLVGAASMGIAKGAQMSSGGPVPGEATFGGDDPRNDTVDAKLSPGEIVIPRHIVDSTDAPQKAAAFVEAIRTHRHNNKSHFDSGGQTGLNSADAGNVLGKVDWTTAWMNPLGAISAAMGNKPGPPTTANGGMLDTGKADATYGQLNSADAALMKSAQGNGPSAIPTQSTMAMDANIANTLAGMGGARGNLAAISAGVGAGGAGAQNIAGNAGSAKAAETGRARGALGDALQRQRAQSLSQAVAQQQAEFGNTERNAGLSLANQASLRAAIAGAGSAASAYGSMGNNVGGGNSASAWSGNDLSGTGAETSPYSSSDFSQQGSVESDKAQGMSKGGKVKAKAFLEAIRQKHRLTRAA
jgi:hypothetical protein